MSTENKTKAYLRKNALLKILEKSDKASKTFNS